MYLSFFFFFFNFVIIKDLKLLNVFIKIEQQSMIFNRYIT